MSVLSKRIFGCLGLAIAGAFASLTPRAHAQELDWIRQFGTSSSDAAFAVANDGAGGVLVAGHTRGSLGGPNAGRHDVFLARYDSAGNQLGIWQFGTSTDDFVWGGASDGMNGVLVAGETFGSLGGPNAGGWDAFLARHDSAGSQLWIRQFGTSSTDTAYGIASDGAGGMLVAGFTRGSLGGPNAGGDDAFLARYDGAGERLWIRQFGTGGNDTATALAPDRAGGVLVAGWTSFNHAFLARYDAAGERLWIRQFGTGYPWGLAPDGAGGVLVAGYTEGSLGGPNAGGLDAFLARYNSAGEQLWIRQFGTSRNEFAYRLAPDGAGGVLVAGETQGSLAGPNAGGRDAFLAHYDSTGNQLWIRQFGTSADDVALAPATDGAGGVMVAGQTGGSLGGPNAGGNDAFLARFSVTACPADLNNDGVIDLADLGILLADFGCTAGPPPACPGDIDNDGDTDLADLGILLANFGTTCP